MRSLGGSGVWELFVPDAATGQAYKFRILGADGVWRDKADPLALRTPRSRRRRRRVVYESSYDWADDDWLDERARSQPHAQTDERLRGAPRLLAARTVLSRSWPSS